MRNPFGGVEATATKALLNADGGAEKEPVVIEIISNGVLSNEFGGYLVLKGTSGDTEVTAIFDLIGPKKNGGVYSMPTEAFRFEGKGNRQLIGVILTKLLTKAQSLVLERNSELLVPR